MRKERKGKGEILIEMGKKKGGGGGKKLEEKSLACSSKGKVYALFFFWSF